MNEDTPFWLHSVSLVVTAEFHNPSILNPDFLVSNKIVPKDWEVADAITTPQVSVVRYRNGIEWTVEQSKLIVVEGRETPFQDNYRVHRLVTNYLQKLPYVPYRSLGLNCVVSVKQEAPAQWLTQRFLKAGPWIKRAPRVVGMMPKFTLNGHGAVCHLSFRPGKTTAQQGQPDDGVIVNANMHHAGPLNVNGLRQAIKQWPRHQSFVISALDKLLKRPQE